jgi:hypothetical protein
MRKRNQKNAGGRVSEAMHAHAPNFRLGYVTMAYRLEFLDAVDRDKRASK